MDCTQKVRVSEGQPRSPEPGVLAQLEERSTSNWKVDGSSPLIATSKAKVLITCNFENELIHLQNGGLPIPQEVILPL